MRSHVAKSGPETRACRKWCSVATSANRLGKGSTFAGNAKIGAKIGAIREVHSPKGMNLDAPYENNAFVLAGKICHSDLSSNGGFFPKWGHHIKPLELGAPLLFRVNPRPWSFFSVRWGLWALLEILFARPDGVVNPCRTLGIRNWLWFGIWIAMIAHPLFFDYYSTPQTKHSWNVLGPFMPWLPRNPVNNRMRLFVSFIVH